MALHAAVKDEKGKVAGAEKAAATEKIHDKVVEKRRALGRGLESLLPSAQRAGVGPGPRAVSGQTAVSTQSSSASEGRSADAVGVPRLRDGTGSADAVAPLGMTGGTGIAGGDGHATVAELLAAGDGDDVVQVRIADIHDNPYQTRTQFDEDSLRELSSSIKAQGVLQPIVVRQRADGKLVLILGERRLRAAGMAGLETIPAIVRKVSDQQAAEMTIVENLQRQDLNCVDQAAAFAHLSQKFLLTQEQIGARVGVARETVANYMRLLSLPEGVVGALQTGKLTYSHARVLLKLRDNVKIWSLAQKVMNEKLSVAKLEDLVFGAEAPPGATEKSAGQARWVDPNVKAAQRSLEEVLGMRVRIRDRAGRGRIQIDYATLEDFDRVVRMLKGTG